MQSASRRAFLTGRRAAQSPWDAFLSRLRRTVRGSVHDFETDQGSARLVPEQMQDVHHARALCLEHGVVLALDGVPHAARLADGPVLWIEPGRAMARYERLGTDDPRWFVQPGCLIGELEAAGLPAFRDQPPQLTVAAWLADRRTCDWPVGQTADSGLVHALVLLADGTQANLGAFGVNNQRALDNLRVQRLVSQLFSIPTAATGDGPSWDARYRLDALHPGRGDANLAQLLLGHGGELGWVEWLVFDERRGCPVDRPYGQRYGQRVPATDCTACDLEVRQLFDPQGLFPMQAQQFESS